MAGLVAGVENDRQQAVTRFPAALRLRVLGAAQNLAGRDRGVVLRPSDFNALSTGTLRCGFERSADHISQRCIEGLIALPSPPKRALGIPAARSCSVTAVARTGMADGTRCRARAACPG